SFNGPGSPISPVGLTDLVRVRTKGGDDFVKFSGSFFLTDIDGGIGDDTLKGAELDDLILGGKGNDIIQGNGGDDDLRGQAGDDTIRGNDGDDTITGGGGEDFIRGGDGNDVIDGGSRDDDIAGNNGDDLLDGGKRHDRIDGGNGNDTIDDTSGGMDTVVGGRGADLFLVGDGDSGDIYDLNDPTGSANRDIVRVVHIPVSSSPEVDTILGFDATLGDGDGEIDQVDLTALGKTFVSVQGFAGNGRIDIYNTAGELAYKNPSYSLIMDDYEEFGDYLVGNFPGANVRVVTGTTFVDEYGDVRVI
ncbi:MAG: hypothetical protein KIT00_13510, partial [Rhodospirillales bacterium]|nr:hypothetical protein [Rhodospirillales bacterium]